MRRLYKREPNTEYQYIITTHHVPTYFDNYEESSREYYDATIIKHTSLYSTSEQNRKRAIKLTLPNSLVQL